MKILYKLITFNNKMHKKIMIEERETSMYKGLVLADVHIGALSYEQTCKECNYLKTLLKAYSNDGKNALDFIIVAGDFFDKQLYGNDPYISLALKLMLRIIMSAKKVRVVYGTSSHDSDQYKLFDALIEEAYKMGGITNNFKVISTVEEEELFPDLHVLYIPEEYVFDADSYYAEYFREDRKYDYVFGHGMIYEAFGGRIKEPEKRSSSRRKAPIFRSGDLSRICKGNVYFGHYHVHTEMDNVKYVGSFSRWIFGEEENKGFYEIYCDLEKGEYWDKFILNDEALRYVTFAYSYKDSVFDSTEEMNTYVQNIIKQKERKAIDYLRVIFNIPVGYENPEALINFFKEVFKDQPSISVEFKNGYIEQKKEIRKKAIEELPSEYRVILDKNIPEEDKINAFLKFTKNVEIAPEKIRKYLNL